MSQALTAISLIGRPMPKSIGSPITISNGQPQREVERFQVFVSYDTAGVPSFSFQAFGTIRLRDGSGNVIHQDNKVSPLISLDDASIPAPVRTAFVSIVNKLDTL